MRGAKFMPGALGLDLPPTLLAHTYEMIEWEKGLLRRESPLMEQSGVLLLRVDMSGIGAEADMRRHLAPVANGAMTQTGHRPKVRSAAA